MIAAYCMEVAQPIVMSFIMMFEKKNILMLLNSYLKLHLINFNFNLYIQRKDTCLTYFLKSKTIYVIYIIFTDIASQKCITEQVNIIFFALNILCF